MAMEVSVQGTDASAERVKKILDAYKPKAIGGGAEHIVYAIPGHPNVVVKVEHNQLFDRLEKKRYAPFTAQETTSFVEGRNRRVKELAHYFGPHVLAEKTGIKTLPIPPDIRKRYADKDPNVPHEIPMVATVQHKSRALASAELYSLNEYLSIPVDDVDDPIKDAALSAWAFGQDAPEGREAMVLFAKRFPGLSQVVWEVRDSQDGDDVMRSFAETAIRYSQDTGEALDIIGANNIVFYREGKKWNYECLDALFRFPKLVDQAMMLFSRFEEDPSYTFSPDDLDKAVFAVHYVEIVNGIAAMLKIHQRLLPWNGLKSGPDTVKKVLRKLAY